MRSIHLAILAGGLILGSARLSCAAAIYYTSTNGSDAAPGDATAPFRTIRRGVEALRPSDVLVVQHGYYDERVSTVRGGASHTARITIQSDGPVRMKGWIVNHPYITIRGFQVSGHSAPSVIEANVVANRGGNFLQLLDSTIGPASHRVLPSVRFDARTTNVISLTGGFLDAGIAPGMTVFFGSGANTPRLVGANQRANRVLEVTDTTLVLSNSVVDQGPLPVYVTPNSVYGLYLSASTQGAVVSNCRFIDLGYDSLFILGSDHVLQENVIERANGWDVMHFGGTNLLFRRNHIKDSPISVFQVSPDAMENYSPTPYRNVMFKENFFQDFAGVIAAQKGGGTSSNLLLLRNVFIDLQGPLLLSHGNTEIRNNTFLRVAKTNNPVVSVFRHPVVALISTAPAPGAPAATNTLVLNNIFLDCGQPNGNLTPQDVGWYAVDGDAGSFTARGNYAAGGPPDYHAKRNWPEEQMLTGGDPQLVSLADPLGPDGLPFTSDDGLRPRPTSGLIKSGIGGVTIGAYRALNEPPIHPALTASDSGGGTLVLSWPLEAADWTLESSVSTDGPWYGVPVFPTVSPEGCTVTILRTGDPTFFRLVE